MRVVITGGAGFIGSRLAHYWRREHPDDDLIVLDALTYAGHRESLRDLEGREGFHFVQADICDESRVATELRDVDLVIHLAAETHNDRAVTNPMPFVRANVVGTASLLEACRKAGVPKFHHVSTDEVFGSLPLDSRDRFTESTPYSPRGPYSASKAAADHLVRAWAETFGLRVTLSNCSNNFGPFQHPEKLIPRAITRLIEGDFVPIYGDGLHVRDWIFVDDHCSALDQIVHRGQPGRTYLVSAGSELSNLTVVHRILTRMGSGVDPIRFVPDRPGHDRRYALDPSRLREELGWRPAHAFDEALRETIDWYRQNEAWWRPLLAPRRAEVVS